MEFDAFADGKHIGLAAGADAAVFQRGHPGGQDRYERIGFRSVKKHQRFVDVPDALGPGGIITGSRGDESLTQVSVNMKDPSTRQRELKDLLPLHFWPQVTCAYKSLEYTRKSTMRDAF